MGMLGADPSAVLLQIVNAQPEITQVSFGAPRVNPPLRERVRLSRSELEFVNQKLNRHRDLNLPAWMLCLLSESEVSDGILTAASFHQGIEQTRFSVNVKELTIGVMAELAKRSGSDRVFSICSQVELMNDSIKHIPMMDFQCRKSSRSLELVVSIVRRFGIGAGVILETDRSYHFYGSQLLSHSELAPFLGRALLFAPIVDQAWIAHQLIDMCCALRAGPRRPGGEAPRVVAFC